MRLTKHFMSILQIVVIFENTIFSMSSIVVSVFFIGHKFMFCTFCFVSNRLSNLFDSACASWFFRNVSVSSCIILKGAMTSFLLPSAISLLLNRPWLLWNLTKFANLFKCHVNLLTFCSRSSISWREVSLNSILCQSKSKKHFQDVFERFVFLSTEVSRNLRISGKLL